MSVASTSTIGDLLRDWRQRRRLSQLDLAVEAQVSARHLSGGVAPELLAPPINTLRVTLHPGGLAPRIVNFAEYSAHLMENLHRQAVLAADPKLFELEKELRGYPGVSEADRHDPMSALFVPLVFLAGNDHELRFFSTLTTFGTALDITMAELTIEALFPADAATAAAGRAAWD